MRDSVVAIVLAVAVAMAAALAIVSPDRPPPDARTHPQAGPGCAPASPSFDCAAAALRLRLALAALLERIEPYAGVPRPVEPQVAPGSSVPGECAVQHSRGPGHVRASVRCRQESTLTGAAGRTVAVSISSVTVASTSSTEFR
jgi:hypothetical protein